MSSYQSVKEEIKRASDIVEIIGQFVQLRKAGQNYVGLCPFHSEKDPSFTVSQPKQMFHCFGCKKGGDVFAFWMEYHKSSFVEAVKDLAERYHISIPEQIYSPEEKRRTELRGILIKINEIAAEYFLKSLSDPKSGKLALNYLERRALSREISSEFRLGYAPERWDGLTSFMRGRKVKMDLAVQAGLIVPRKNGGFYDRFRGRIIFPIFNIKGQIIGFGGRVLDDALPKYLNTPETPLFHKGRSLYGLHASFKDIRDKESAVVVEGYMDFLALRRNGINNAVATLGTAMTSDHIRKLKGYAKEVVIVFDSDEAGKSAALNTLPIFLNEGFSARAVVLPDGQDPDSYVTSYGPDNFIRLLKDAPTLFDFYLEQKLSPIGSNIDGKVGVLKEIIPILSELRNSAQKAMYARYLSNAMSLREDVIWDEIKKSRQRSTKKITETSLKERLISSKVEKKFNNTHLLNLLIHYPHTTEKLMKIEWKILLSDPEIVDIVETFFEKYRSEGMFSPENLLENLDNDSSREQFREALLTPAFYSREMVELAVNEFMDKIQQLKLSESIQKARANGDFEGLNRLLKQKSEMVVRAFGG